MHTTDTTLSLAEAETWAARAIAIAGGAAAEAHGYLRGYMLQVSEGITLVREGRPGAKARPIDAFMNRTIAELVERYTHGVSYLSEEEEVTAAVEPGGWIARADPFDGTTLALATLTGWATVVFFERLSRNSTRLMHVAGAIATFNGTIVSWWMEGRSGVVRVDLPPRPQYHADLPELEPLHLILSAVEGGVADDVRAGSADAIAAVASSITRQRIIEETYDLRGKDGLFFVNTAGNPILPALLLGDLGVVIEPCPVSPHDGVWALVVRLAGGYVADPNGQPLDIFEFFEQLSEKNRMISPFVAGMNRERVEAVLERRRS